MLSSITLTGLVILIIGAPLAVGSVYIVTYSALEAIVFSLLLLHIFASFSPKKNGNATSGTRHEASAAKVFFLLLPLFLFLCLCLFQLLPVPLSFIRLISPNTALLYEKLGMTANPSSPASPYYPLSLSLYSSSAAILKWCAYIGVFILIVTFSPHEKRLKKDAWLKVISVTLFIIGFSEAIYGLFLYLNHSDALLWFTRVYYKGFVNGTFINKNHFACFMNLSIFVSLGFLTSYIGSYKRKHHHVKETLLNIFTSEKSLFAYLFLLGLLTMILAVIFSGSRMGQASLFAGFIFLGILYSVKRLKLFAFVLILVFGMATLWGAWKGVDPVIERWNTTDIDLTGRDIIWQSTLALSRDFPFTGTGLGTYQLAYPPYKPEKLGAVIMDHAHNDYLEILSEVGWVGLGLWLSFFLIFFYMTISAWLKRHNIFARSIGAGGLAAIVAVLVHSLADFNLQIPANALLLFVVMAMTWQAVHNS